MTTNQLHSEKNLADRRNRFVRTATIAIFALASALDVMLWIFKLQPDNLVVMVLLLPLLASIYLAFQGRTNQAVWVITIAFWAAGIFLVLNDPQTPLEIDDLVGRYLFPIIFVIPIAAVSIREKVQRNVIIGGTLLVSVGAAYLGFVNDLDGTATPDPVFVGILNGLIFIVLAGLLFTLVRNFTSITSWFANLSIRYRLTLFVLAFFIPAVVYSGLVSAFQAGTEIELAQQQTLQETHFGLSQTTNIWLEENLHSLETAADFPAILSMDPAQQKPVLVAMEANNPHAFVVHTTNTEGFNVARSDDSDLVSYSDRVWFQGSMAGNDYTLQSLLSRTTGEPTLAISVPIQQENGAIEGALLVALEFNEVSEAVGASVVGETGVSYIVDAEGYLIAHTDRAYFSEQELINFSSHPAIAALRNGEEGIFNYVDENNQQKIAYLGKIEEFDWGVVIELDEAEVTAPARNMVNRTSIGFVIVIVPIVLLLWFVLGRTVKPVTELTAVTSAYASGNFDARATVRSEDEVGQLGRAFNQMAAQVYEQTSMLQERAKEMEASQRVTFAASERTSPEDFLDLLVNLLVDQFDVYHAQVYLVDEARQNAVLSQSTGYAGRVLLQRKHHIPMERESLVTRCINSGQSVLVANTRQESGWLPNDLLPYTESELVVPLKVEGQVIGALDIQDRVADRFSSETVPVFESMTEQVAFLYQNNELLQEIESSRAAQERFAKQLATAAFIANQLGSILELEQLLNQAVSMMQSEFNLYHAHIYLLDEAKENLVVQAGSGHVGVILKERGHSIPVNREQSLVARSFRDRFPVLVEDVTLAENFMANPLLPDTRSELAVPLVSRGEVIGVLDIQDETVGRFTEVDANTMNTLAVQMATAIENAQLFRQTAEERKRFEALVTYAPDAILMLNHETYKWMDANRNAEAMFGMTRRELLKIGPGELSPEYQPDGRESGEKAVEMIGNAVAGGDSQFEWVHTNASGEEFVCEIRLAVLPGEDKQLLVNITDITNRKQAQNAIIEGDKLKSEFLANMSHELRTPLNSIVGYTDVLLMGVDGELNEEMLLDVQAIQENSQLLLGIINDILDLAKIEAKRVIFEIAEVGVRDVLENVVRNNAGLLVNKPVEMKIETTPDLPVIEVDQMRVEQVLNNLVSNAAKFTEKGYITLRAFTEPGWMVLEVEDTGAGIKEADLQVIFEEFRQADGSQTRTVEGTGLGLTITRRLVHMHGGTIRVESEYGKGSTFTVRLPLETRINSEVTVKKVEKKARKPVLEAVSESAATSGSGSAGETAVKANGKKNGSSQPETDLKKATERFTDALKEAVEKAGPSGEEKPSGEEDADQS